MPQMPQLSNARSELHLPHMSLVGCMRGVMLRDTRGVRLEPEKRFSHYPATPLCSISWYLEGEIDMLEPNHSATLKTLRQPMRARLVFSGPQTQPTVTWSRGEAHGLMLLLLPDAFYLLTGVDPQRWLNRTVAASDVLPQDWNKMCAEVHVAADDLTRVQLIQDFLAPLWQACRPKQELNTHLYVDWVQSIALRAATSHMGRSLRQIERRILQWAGQPIRELRGFVRAERAFFDFMAKAESMPIDWADLAHDHGFSDQSHLCRISRRMTGFAPKALYERITQDEGFWPYRIWQ